MVLKQTYHTHERTTFVVRPVTRWLKGSLTPSQYKGLHKLPRELLIELEQFIERNTLATVYDSHCKIAKKEFCKPCLKAHAFVMADAMGLGKEGLRVLNAVFEGKEGHEGYYLDEELLISLDGRDL